MLANYATCNYSLNEFSNVNVIDIIERGLL